jgi:hypothetical protein
VGRIEVKGEKAGVECREAEGGQGRRLEVKVFLIMYFSYLLQCHPQPC